MRNKQTYSTCNNIPQDAWRWSSFSPQEIACRGTGEILVHEAALDNLEEMRRRLGKPIMITSAYRSKSHNRKVGGARRSQHLKGMAFDISMQNQNPFMFEAIARSCGFTGFGFYPKQNFMHIDMGAAREWGKRWTHTEPEFSVENVPFMKKPAIKKTTTSAGALTIAAGGLAMANPGGNRTSVDAVEIAPITDTAIPTATETVADTSVETAMETVDTNAQTITETIVDPAINQIPGEISNALPSMEQMLSFAMDFIGQAATFVIDTAPHFAGYTDHAIFASAIFGALATTYAVWKRRAF